MGDNGNGDDIGRLLEEGRARRHRRHRTSRRLTMFGGVLLIVSLLAVPGDMDWLRALLLNGVMALHVGAAIVTSRGDEAARQRLAMVSMWGLLGLGVATLAVGVGYSFAGEKIPADVALVGPILVGMAVVLLADAPSDSDERPTASGGWEAEAGG